MQTQILCGLKRRSVAECSVWDLDFRNRLQLAEVFYLPLSDPSKSVPSIRTEMQTIQADCAQLLFLRRVTEISLRGDWAADESEQEMATWARLMVAGSPDQRAATTCQRYQHTGSEPVLVEENTTRFQISSHEDVVVALPKLEEPPPQRVFAYLPVRSVARRTRQHSLFSPGIPLIARQGPINLMP